MIRAALFILLLASPASALTIADVQVTPQVDACAFSVTFSEEPDFVGADGCQFYVAWEPVPYYMPYQTANLLLRALPTEISIIPVSPKGEYGPATGSVAHQIAGPSLRFSVPWGLLDSDGHFSWVLAVVVNGALTSDRYGTTHGFPVAVRASSWGRLKAIYRGRP